LGLPVADGTPVSARRVLADVLFEVAYVEFLSATRTLVAKRLPKSQLPAGHVLDAARPAFSTDNDVGYFVYHALAEPVIDVIFEVK